MLPRLPNHPGTSQRFRRFTRDLIASKAPNLNVYTQIDWREDLYQLGYELALQLRLHPILLSANTLATAALARLLWGSPHAKTPVPGLAQRLLDWGSEAQCDPLPAGTVRPHEALIDEIQAVIAQLDPDHDACNQFHFYQADHDAAYRGELKLARHKHRASAAAQARELATWQAECGSLDDWRKAQAQVQARQAAQDQRETDYQTIKSRFSAKVAEHHAAQAALREQTEALNQQAQAQAAQRRQLEADQMRLAGERAALAVSKGLAKARQAALHTPRPVPPMRDQPASLDLVELPQGSYLRGSPDSEAERYPDEGPVAHVSIAYRLAVARHAVTFDLWDQCVAEGGTRHKPEKDFGGGKHPVIKVSWQGIHRDFLPWLNRLCGLDQAHPSLRWRLLTEAEWEYACRAGGTGAFSLGPRNDSQITAARANYDGKYSYANSPKGEYRGSTVPVDNFEPNAWGLYCMHGNTLEWVQDAWADNYSLVPVDGSAHGSPDDAKSARVVRGGSWISMPRWLRSARRDGNSPDERRSNIGFRLARMLP